MGSIQGWHIVIIIVLALLLFGAPKLPGMARSVGQSLRIFKSEVKQMKDENNVPNDGPGPVEGRVVNNPSSQTYAPTQQTPVHPDQHQTPSYGQQNGQQNGSYVADGQPQAPVNGAGQTGPSQQSGTPTTHQ